MSAENVEIRYTASFESVDADGLEKELEARAAKASGPAADALRRLADQVRDAARVIQETVRAAKGATPAGSSATPSAADMTAARRYVAAATGGRVVAPGSDPGVQEAIRRVAAGMGLNVGRFTSGGSAGFSFAGIGKDYVDPESAGDAKARSRLEGIRGRAEKKIRDARRRAERIAEREWDKTVRESQRDADNQAREVTRDQQAQIRDLKARGQRPGGGYRGASLWRAAASAAHLFGGGMGGHAGGVLSRVLHAQSLFENLTSAFGGGGGGGGLGNLFGGGGSGGIGRLVNTLGGGRTGGPPGGGGGLPPLPNMPPIPRQGLQGLVPAGGVGMGGGGGTGGALGSLGTVVGAVLEWKRNFDDATGKMRAGVGTSFRGMVHGNASGMMSGAVQGAQGWAQFVGGPVVGPMLAKLLDPLQKVIGFLDEASHVLKDYNAAIAAAAGKTEALGEMFKIRMGKAMEPALVAWENLKGKVLDSFVKLTPVIERVAEWMGRLIDSIGDVVDFVGNRVDDVRGLFGGKREKPLSESLDDYNANFFSSLGQSVPQQSAGPGRGVSPGTNAVGAPSPQPTMQPLVPYTPPGVNVNLTSNIHTMQAVDAMIAQLRDKVVDVIFRSQNEAALTISMGMGAVEALM